MLLFLLLTILSVTFAEDIQIDEEPEAAESVHSHSYEKGYSYSDGLELIRERTRTLNPKPWQNDHDNDDYDGSYLDREHSHDEELPGPVILRTPHPLPSDGHIDIEAQNRIIEDVYSPDYHQPTWVLDYRYLKTGGRDYVRGPGGQILILPKGVRSKEPKEFPDYDAYLEHLRLSRLSKEQHHQHKDGYGHDYQDHGHGHGQSKWRKI